MQTQYLFFSGKGGVGKTTMAAATAIHFADQGRRTLIVSTDPASNLSDVFQTTIGHRVTDIANVPGLRAMEIDPDEATREYKEGILAPYREMLPEDVLASIDEQLSGPCTTEMAAFDRFIDFMETGDDEVVVFDTAPTGHTIRLLELPVDWSRHIEEASRGTGQTCLGPVQTIQNSKARYDRATALLRDEHTRFIFVMRPDPLSLYETERAAKELATIGVRPAELIVNGLLPDEARTLPFFRSRFDAQAAVIDGAKKRIAVPLAAMSLRPDEVRGIDALRSVAAERFDGAAPVAPVAAGMEISPDAPDVRPVSPEALSSLLRPGGEPKALFFTGKGGVGKSTVSCMTAVALADAGYRTLLVTTDPAAHIGQVLDRPVGSEPTAVTEALWAVLIDQQAAFHEYRERVLAEARGTCSDEMLRAMEEELDSPCTEEMAAFDKFVRYLEGRNFDVVVIDTAPTGHTLRLLDLPFDYARQVEMKAGGGKAEEAGSGTQSRFAEIISFLRDPARTIFSLVLYPEAMPILESRRAMDDLLKAGIETRLVVANMLLPGEACTTPFFRSRRAMQRRHCATLPDRFGLPVAAVPLFREEPRGLDALREAARVFPGKIVP